MTEQSGVTSRVLGLTEVPRLQMSTEHPPDVILRRGFTRPFTALAVIEGLGTSPLGCGQHDHVPCMRWGLGMRLGPKQNIDEAALKI